MASYAKNIVTDYGAPIDGVTDTSVKWDAFVTFLAGLSAGDDVTLTVPAHTYVFNRVGGGGGISLLPGLLGGLTVTVNGTGATFIDNGGTGYFLASMININSDNLHSSRISSVNPGSTSVTLLTPSQNSRYSVGQWIAVTGIDTQGYGYPPNPAFFEYRQITAINAGTGLISFTRPLSNQYLSTWPCYEAGDNSNTIDLGGPATIYAMPYSWDITATYNGITFNCTGQNYFSGRSVTFNGGGSASVAGITPTLNQSNTFNNFDMTGCNIEIDKMVENLTLNNCGNINQLAFQSMGCATHCVVTGTSVTTYNGTPRNLSHTGGAIGSLQIGATAYGRTDSVTINDCVVSAIYVIPANIQDVVLTGYTMSGGVIRWAFAHKAIPWAIPGTNLFWSGPKENENASFRVLSVTDDGVDTIVTTTLTGGFPNVFLQGDAKLNLRVHPCPVWFGSGNSGCADIVDLNNTGAQGKPLFSYSKRPYSRALLTSPTFQHWGQLSAVNVSVTRAYTGIQSTLILEILGVGGADVLTVDRTTTLVYDPLVNLKQTGTRTISPTTVSSQSGDTLGSVPGNIWFCGFQGICANHDISSENSALSPIFEIELISDQGIVPLQVTSLQLRLHS